MKKTHKDDVLLELDTAISIIKVADARNMANDHAGGLPPDMSLAEWKKLYRSLVRARGFHYEQERMNKVRG